MPIYEYACQKCSTHLEVMQKVSDKPLARCRKCGGKLEKQWSQTSFQLKGSGWYVTDYANKSSDAKESKEEKKQEKKSETSPESSTSSEPVKDSTKDSKKKTTKSSKPSSSSGNAGGD